MKEIDKLKLLIISDKIPDDIVRNAFLNFTINDFDEINDAIDILQMHRPKVWIQIVRISRRDKKIDNILRKND